MHNDIPTKGDVSFMQYWDLLSSVGSVSHKEGMRELDRARGNLKHTGQIPTRGDLQRFLSTAESFLQENAPTLFGIALADVSLTHLVTVAAAQDDLQEADRLRNDGKFQSALEHTGKAFYLLRQDFREGLKKAFGSFELDIGCVLSAMTLENLDQQIRWIV